MASGKETSKLRTPLPLPRTSRGWGGIFRLKPGRGSITFSHALSQQHGRTAEETLPRSRLRAWWGYIAPPCEERVTETAVRKSAYFVGASEGPQLNTFPSSLSHGPFRLGHITYR